MGDIEIPGDWSAEWWDDQANMAECARFDSPDGQHIILTTNPHDDNPLATYAPRAEWPRIVHEFIHGAEAKSATTESLVQVVIQRFEVVGLDEENGKPIYSGPRRVFKEMHLSQEDNEDHQLERDAVRRLCSKQVEELFNGL